ncbi:MULTISPECIES: heparan-alpha-glucosaminide N-acetyltransferase domain-containing protein [Paracoccus]|uniref:heparan-alpha-glucosaminide N-acetyltransferase domain-containing protein n=1 Tax=Paracoccus TaxID=265 RepID=UPI000FDC9150|nr:MULTISPECIES: OpgC domain-containing protein [Paracoccus]AZY94272.1 DUF1624 domain-containing protein [Paracoccus sp. Arc7-R13]TNC04499.1 DUF1624 domain-containing protein [Paracoccus marcusii]
MRIIGLDAARSLAIVLAMSSHVFADVGLYAHMSEPLTRVAGFAFQIATPTFILLFGTMLEVVYRPRWTTRQARHGVAMRLLSRAFQCWVLYALTILTLTLTDDGYSVPYSTATILFMGNSPYTEILKFYAIVLAIAPILLWIRARTGLLPLAVAALACHAAWPLLSGLPDVQNDLGAPTPVASLVQFLTGFGDLPLAGPSVLHGLTLVIAGQCLGRYLTGRSPAGSTDPLADPGFGRRVRALLVGGAGVALIGGLFVSVDVIDGLADGSLRRDSNPLYFATGILSATLMTLFFVWMIDIRKVGSIGAWSQATFFGRTSMFTFAWGNVLLYLVAPQPTDVTGAVGWTAALLAALCVMSLGFDRAARRSTTVATTLTRLRWPADWLAERLLWGMGRLRAA